MKFFIAIGSLLVLLLSAALVVPLFVDWTAFREDFEREAGRLLGQPVQVRGDAQARLLPFPSLTFTDVVVGSDEAEPMMTLSRFRMDAELAPYLSGEIRIFQMRLEEPHLRISAGEEESYRAPPGAARSGIVLENVEVSDGRVTVRDARTGRSRVFSGIDASLSAQTLSGPFSGTGSLTFDRRPFTFSLFSGRIAETGEWPLRLTLNSAPLDAAFVFDGATQLGDGVTDFAGRFELHSPLAQRDEPSVLPPLRVTSALELSPERAMLGELRAEVGPREAPYVLTGEGSLDIAGIPHFNLRLQGEQVNVDALPGAEAAEGEGPDLAGRAEAVRRTLAAIPRFDIPGEIDLTLPVVTAGDTTIRETHFRGSPTEEGWAIRSLSAELPGRTLVEASGLLTVRERMGFAGDLLVAARQPGRFASWLSGRPAEAEVAGLSRAGFSGRVWLTGEEQRFEDLEVDVGGQTLTGRLERSGEPGARVLAADLAGGAADLDAFLAFARLFNGGSDVIEPVETLDLRIDAGPVALGPHEAEALAVDFSYGGDVLDLRSLIVSQLSGLTVDARGTVEALTGAARPDLAYEITVTDAAASAALLERSLPDRPLVRDLAARLRLLGAMELSGVLSTGEEGEGLAARLEGQSGATRIMLRAEAGGGLAIREGEGPFLLDATVSSEEPGALLAQAGFEGIDLGLPGPLVLTATLDGEHLDAANLRATLEAPGSRIETEGALAFDRDGVLSADLALNARSEDASLWLLAGGVGLGQGLDALPANLSANLVWGREGWRVADLVGEVVGTSLSGELAATGTESVTGRVALGELSLPWLATLVYAGTPDTLAGTGWPEQPFGTSFLPARPLSLDIEAKRLVLGGGSHAGDLRARLESDGDGLRIVDAAAALADGTLEGSLAMRSSGGFGSVALDLKAENLRTRTGAFSTRAGGEIRAEGSGRSFAELASSLTGEGRASFTDAVLHGIADTHLPAMLAAADEEGASTASEPVADLIRSQDEGASYRLGDFAAPLSIGMGTARMQAVVLERGEDRLTLGGSASLSDFTAEGGLSIAFTPPEDERIEETAPSIAYRLEGDFTAPFALTDVEPLVSYLSVRAYQREQQRLEAMREDLRETVRLRREARYYRHLAAERARVEEERRAAEEAERLRLEEEERRLAEEALAERRRAEEAERAAQVARQAREQAPPPSAPAAPLSDFEPVLPTPQEGPSPRGYEGLPGVAPPLEF